MPCACRRKPATLLRNRRAGRAAHPDVQAAQAGRQGPAGHAEAAADPLHCHVGQVRKGTQGRRAHYELLRLVRYLRGCARLTSDSSTGSCKCAPMLGLHKGTVGHVADPGMLPASMSDSDVIGYLSGERQRHKCSRCDRQWDRFHEPRCTHAAQTSAHTCTVRLRSRLRWLNGWVPVELHSSQRGAPARAAAAARTCLSRSEDSSGTNWSWLTMRRCAVSRRSMLSARGRLRAA